MGGEGSTILLPVDDTQTTDEMVEQVLKTIFRKGDTLVVMHVAPLPLNVHPDAAKDRHRPDDPNPPPVLMEFLRRRVLDRLDAAGVPYKLSVVYHLADSRSIGDAICAKAEEVKADLVCIKKRHKARGLAGLAQRMLGSVSDYVAHHCLPNVLLLS